jgi:hypothetical protein
LDCSKDAAGIAGPRNPEGRRKKTERKKPAQSIGSVDTKTERGHKGRHEARYGDASPFPFSGLPPFK